MGTRVISTYQIAMCRRAMQAIAVEYTHEQALESMHYLDTCERDRRQLSLPLDPAPLLVERDYDATNE
jgi:hypothetical protein